VISNHDSGLLGLYTLHNELFLFIGFMFETMGLCSKMKNEMHQGAVMSRQGPPERREVDREEESSCRDLLDAAT
jgi:hypothetical protein